MPKISVIIPTYGHARYVLATLATVFEQDFKDFEIVIVNDGSPDDTREVLAPLVAQGKVRYFEQSNAGQAAARNKGFAEAKGEYIALLDDDDLWPADKLSWQCALLDDDESIGIVAGIAEVIDRDGTRIGAGSSTIVGEIDHRSLLRGNPITSPGQMLIRGDVLRTLGGFNETIWGADDWDLLFRASKITRIVIRDRLGLSYRMHTGNASRDVRRLVANTFVVVGEQLRFVPASQLREVKRDLLVALFEYWGLVAMNSALFHVKSGRIKRAVADASALEPFFVAAIKDPWLFKAWGRFLFSKLRTKVLRAFGKKARCGDRNGFDQGDRTRQQHRGKVHD